MFSALWCLWCCNVTALWCFQLALAGRRARRANCRCGVRSIGVFFAPPRRPPARPFGLASLIIGDRPFGLASLVIGFALGKFNPGHACWGNETGSPSMHCASLMRTGPFLSAAIRGTNFGQISLRERRRFGGLVQWQLAVEAGRSLAPRWAK